MKTWIKVSLAILSLILLASLVVFRPRKDPTGIAGTTQGPAFEFYVIKPRMARPLFGILPTSLEEKLEAGAERRFDHKSPGARVVRVASNRLELSADDWSLFLESNNQGAIAPNSYLIYTMMLAEKQRRLRCQPAEEPTGYLRAATRPASIELDGRFQVELATCKNEETGKIVEWPPAPLTLRGSFARLSGN